MPRAVPVPLCFMSHHPCPATAHCTVPTNRSQVRKHATDDTGRGDPNRGAPPWTLSRDPAPAPQTHARGASPFEELGILRVQVQIVLGRKKLGILNRDHIASTVRRERRSEKDRHTERGDRRERAGRQPQSRQKPKAGLGAASTARCRAWLRRDRVAPSKRSTLA